MTNKWVYTIQYLLLDDFSKVGPVLEEEKKNKQFFGITTTSSNFANFASSSNTQTVDCCLVSGLYE